MPYIRILAPRQPSPWHRWGDVDKKSVLDNKLTWAGEGFGSWIQKSLSCCSLAKGLPTMLAKVASAVVSLNCCRQSTSYYGTLREGRVNKAAEGKEARISSKHPMLESSENNELDRFQKQSLLRASAMFA